MPTPVLATVGLGALSGLPEDVVDLDWAFLAADTDPTTIDGIQSSIEDWFNVTNTSTNAMADYIASSRSRAANAVTVDYYDLTGHLDGSPHGSPFDTRAFTLGGSPTVAGDLPDEVAIRMSLTADGAELVPETAANPTPPPATIRPRARYRGGFFFGPPVAGTRGTTSPMRPTNADFLQDAEDAWARFMDERGGDFAVWSRADEDLKLIAPGGTIHVDNAYDTIRKRGPAPSARTVVWP